MSDWIDRLGDDEEQRRKLEELHRRKHFHRAEIIRQQRPALWTSLIAVVNRDVEKFRAKFAGRRSVEITPVRELGFRIYKSPYPTVLMDAELPPDGTSIKVTYTRTFNHISPMEKSEESFELTLDSFDNLAIAHNGRIFSNLDDVSRCLLEPVFAID